MYQKKYFFLKIKKIQISIFILINFFPEIEKKLIFFFKIQFFQNLKNLNINIFLIQLF